MASIIVGADLGNDTCKVVFGSNNYRTLKNAVSKRMESEARNNLVFENESEAGLIDNLDIIIRSRSISGRFFVGKLATRNGEDTVQAGTVKADNPQLLVPLLALLAIHCLEQKKSRFRIVCGLPINEFSATRERFKNLLEGEYYIEFVANGRTASFVLDEVHIIPEGVAALLNQMLSPDGSTYRRPYLRQGHYGIIDIGAFTTDIPIFADGKTDSDASVGLDVGIAHYLDKIVSHLNQIHAIKMTRTQLVERIELEQFVLPIRGKRIDIRPYIDEQFELFANKIVAVVDDLWSKHYAVQEFFVVGGGAKALRPYLAREMRTRNINLTFNHETDPQMENAFGNYKYATLKFGATKP